MWIKLKSPEDIKKVEVGTKIKISGQITVLKKQYGLYDNGFRTKHKVSIGGQWSCEVISDSNTSKFFNEIEYWKEPEFIIKDLKVNAYWLARCKGYTRIREKAHAYAIDYIKKDDKMMRALKQKRIRLIPVMEK